MSRTLFSQAGRINSAASRSSASKNKVSPLIGMLSMIELPDWLLAVIAAPGKQLGRRASASPATLPLARDAAGQNHSDAGAPLDCVVR
jgi:hypothetical protein